MASTHLCSNRREFLKTGLASGAAALFASRFARAAQTGTPAASQAPVAAPASSAAMPSKVALINGDNRTDNILKGLKALEKEIAQSIGNRRVVIKPNNVVANNQLACTHADALIAICDFLKGIGKLDNAIIAESGTAATMRGFEFYGYPKVAEKYKVKLVDLDQEKYETVMAFDQSDAKPHPVRVSSILANQKDNFIISACVLKTHNYAVATMSIKNIILGAPLKFPASNTQGGPRGAAERAMFPGSDKPILHGGGSHGININLAMLAPMLHPSLSVIDGFEGMEGNGPIGGTKVDHKVCVISTDYLAADTVGASLMGIDPKDMGYLTYLAQARAGEFDVSKMEILGDPIAKHVKKYQPGTAIEDQLKWKDTVKVAAAS
jgi:uncharacterized protein (DUF362 family)